MCSADALEQERDTLAILAEIDVSERGEWVGHEWVDVAELRGCAHRSIEPCERGVKLGERPAGEARGPDALLCRLAGDAVEERRQARPFLGLEHREGVALTRADGCGHRER